MPCSAVGIAPYRGMILPSLDLGQWPVCKTGSVSPCLALSGWSDSLCHWNFLFPVLHSIALTRCVLGALWSIRSCDSQVMELLRHLFIFWIQGIIWANFGIHDWVGGLMADVGFPYLPPLPSHQHLLQTFLGTGMGNVFQETK